MRAHFPPKDAPVRSPRLLHRQLLSDHSSSLSARKTQAGKPRGEALPPLSFDLSTINLIGLHKLSIPTGDAHSLLPPNCNSDFYTSRTLYLTRIALMAPRECLQLLTIQTFRVFFANALVFCGKTRAQLRNQRTSVSALLSISIILLIGPPCTKAVARGVEYKVS